MKIRAVLIFTMIIAVSVSAFDISSFGPVQWLSYCTSDSAGDIVGGSSSNVDISSDKPEGMVLPELINEDVRYARWSHEMGAKKDRQIILDRQKKYGKYDIMHFDSNGDGKFSADERYSGQRRDDYRVNFNGIPVYFDTEDGLVTYHLNFYYYSYRSDYERLYAQNGCWYEGNIDIGEDKIKCTLVDFNLNGSFDDISDSFNSDRILIGDGAVKYETRAGKYLEYKNKLYNLSIARDGAFIKLTSAEDVPYSQLEIPAQVSSFVCGGVNGLFKRDNIIDGKISLPAGSYKVRSWETKSKSSKGRQWEIGASWYSGNDSFEIKENAIARVNVGEKVYSTLSVSHNSGTFYFNHRLAGNNGESVTLTQSGRQPAAPKIRIYNRDRTYDQTFTLEYG